MLSLPQAQAAVGIANLKEAVLAAVAAVPRYMDTVANAVIPGSPVHQTQLVAISPCLRQSWAQ